MSGSDHSRRGILQAGGLGILATMVPGLLARPALAAAAPDWAMAAAGGGGVHGGRIVYAQTYPNWALGASDRGEHPYFWIDLLTRSVWNQLTWVDHDYTLRAELATAWRPADATLKVWDFDLREGVLFHSGREMTSDDVVASMELHRSGIGFFKAEIASIEARGKYGVRFVLNSPNAEWPWILAEYRAAVLQQDAAEKIGFDGIGTGPFKLVEIDNKRGFKAVRNDRYWMDGLPYLDALEGTITSSQAAINGFRAGEFDAVFNIDPTTSGQYETVGGQIHRSPGGDQFLLKLPKNVDMPWKDVRVRKALALAIDRRLINRIVYNDPDGWTGNDTHMNGLNREFVARPVERDVAMARKLLAEAGYKDGVKLPTVAYCPSFPEEVRIYPIVTESLREAGIEMAFEERPCDGFWQYHTATNKPIGRPARILVGPRNAAINMGRMARQETEHGGWVGEHAERYQALYAQALAEADDGKRMAIYQEIQRVTQEDVPAIMLGGRRNMLAYRPWVNGLRSHSQNWSSRFESAWVDARKKA